MTTPQHPSSPKPSWEQHYASLQAFKAAHGDCGVPLGYLSPDGIPLGRWLRDQKAQARERQYPAEKRERLDDIGVALPSPLAGVWTAHEDCGMRHPEESDLVGGETDNAPRRAEIEGITREEWVTQAMRLYLIAGDTEEQARECAEYLWDELDMDDLADPIDAAMQDVEGRGPVPQAPSQSARTADAEMPGARLAKDVAPLEHVYLPDDLRSFGNQQFNAGREFEAERSARLRSQHGQGLDETDSKPRMRG